MSISPHNQLLREEFDQYYANFDPACERLLEGLEQTILAHPEDSNYGKKSRMHEYLCQECPVKIFRHTPLFFEISSGRGRHTWGGLQSEVGLYLHDASAPYWLDPYIEALKEDRKEGFMHGAYSPVSLDHHCPGYDRILSWGLQGIIDCAYSALQTCDDPVKQDFYRCVIRSNQALIHLAGRFSAEAAALAEKAFDPEEKRHYDKISQAAAWVPAHPPRTFYEALCAIVFYRECVGSIEGIGFSTFGHLDRMLYPYYAADLAAGRTTREEAMELICDLLTYTYVRFEAGTDYRETSTTIELGGCDAQGNVNYNALTELILDAVMDVKALNTKINCRISKAHPRAYLEKIAKIQLSQLPCVMMHNDDVLIPARVKQGQALEDARLYVGGGCHEIVLANTEVSTRADTWINMPRILLKTLEDAKEGGDYEAFYQAFLMDAQAYINRLVAIKNRGEVHWCQYNPMPLYSSSMTGCLESGKDLTEGGAKYNTTALSMLGTASLIDSLYTIKRLVFDDKKLTFAQLRQVLQNDYRDDEGLRQSIIHQLPKYGTGDEMLDSFAVEILSDLSRTAGQTNGRGGAYLPAFYPHDIYRQLGNLTGATPDGRHAHQPLSRGASPSEFVETDSPLDVIHSVKSIDFTQYADSFITEITLPQMTNDERSLQILVGIILAFLDAEGSSLQFNLLNRDLLLDARRNPEQHKNLFVRVCGYSAAFIYLNEETQNEIINRAIR